MGDILFVGDVQGCAAELHDLLRVAGFDRHRHRLALCGDLVNRGPDSAAVLQLARDLDLTELRTADGQPWFDFWRGPETVIFGHWAQRGKVDLELCKGLDTGCVYGGQLTGLWRPRLEWVSVPAARPARRRSGRSDVVREPELDVW